MPKLICQEVCFSISIFSFYILLYEVLLWLKDCELLENDICRQEYAIAKKHHLLGRVVHFPNCSSLPKTDCFELGIEKPEVNEGNISDTMSIFYLMEP